MHKGLLKGKLWLFAHLCEDLPTVLINQQLRVKYVCNLLKQKAF